ncbi:unnamed protein product [Echinostoma caproni]|uniref:Rubicon Homology domain-containing protein n=1 Tax=Echinostoma caproni TaxID=27848 RepID=A0A3P8FK49_9TREM|nr:unnamed protein product [Echinostoma caproni]
MILLNQKNCCAGCGLFIETSYLKRMRFCEFFGKFFCCVCHTNTLMVLPGCVLTAWDFRMLPVSNIARDRLNQLHRQPLLRLSDFSPRVVQTQAALRNCATLRKQGNMILPFVQFCHNDPASSLRFTLRVSGDSASEARGFAGVEIVLSFKADISWLHWLGYVLRMPNHRLPHRTLFAVAAPAQCLLSSLKALPPHWLSNPELWSIADLCAVRDGQLDRELRQALQPIVDHLSACTRCRAQGFVCEICHSGQILFPFGQINTVACPVCMACFHRSCLRNPKPDNCPRCLRRAQRRVQRQEQQQQRHSRSPHQCEDSDQKGSSRELLC